MELEDELEAALLERLAGRVLRFGDPVAVEHEEVARLEARFRGRVLGVLEEPKRDARCRACARTGRRAGG